MLVDLESFHEFNDALGPERADELLVQAPRGSGTSSRDPRRATGEDEFGLSSLTRLTTIRAIRWRSKSARHSSRRLNVGDQRIVIEVENRLRASFPRHGTEPDVLLRRAGVALSIAKKAARQGRDLRRRP